MLDGFTYSVVLFDLLKGHDVSNITCIDIEKSKVSKSVKCGFSRSKFLSLYQDKKVNLYLIKIFNNEELFFKIGLTSRTIKRRFNELSKYGYQYSIIDSFLIRGEEAYDKEKELQNLCKEYNYKPKTSYPGYTESFNKEIITIYEQFKNKYF